MNTMGVVVKDTASWVRPMILNRRPSNSRYSPMAKGP